MTNIFVAKLDYGITQEQLKAAFAEFGQVNKVSIAIDKETGKSKGFAFIEMMNDEEAQQAIDNLNGSTMNGREIAVKKADDRSSDNRPKKDFSRDQQSSNRFQGRPSDRPTYDRNSGGDRSNTGSKLEYKDSFKADFNPADKPEIPVLASFDNLKGEGRKKDDKIKKKEPKAKTHKMEAYKKSGKQQKYDLFDDEDDDFQFEY